MIGKRIRKLRLEKDIQQKELAAALGIRQATVSEWEAERSEPQPKLRKKIANFFGITEAELFTDTPLKSKEFEPLDTPLQKVPVISWVSANRFGSANDPFPVGYSDEWVYTTRKGENMFSLVVKGDCMIPEFQDGDRIVINPHLAPQNGDYVVCKDDHADEASFKQYKVYGDKIILHPLNPKYEDLEVKGNKYRIIGVVVEKVKKYR